MSPFKFIYPQKPTELSEINRIARIAGLQAYSEDHLKSLTENPAYLVMFLQVPDVSRFPVGYLVAQITPPEAEIYDIAVLPVVQGRGLGTRMLKKLLAILQEEDVQHCFLEVRPSNRPALMFYTRHGFTRQNIRKDYYSFPREDAILLHLNLDENTRRELLS
ncbi:MAG: ribosomal protein S18-alanine N-acetyltransferase [Acidobacteria bacterium]|nr:ribosomal protein S18-alanine N-acetyltransferase [Acidobacteriota bacterium]